MEIHIVGNSRAGYTGKRKQNELYYIYYHTHGKKDSERK